jgi:hypothetical protein
MSTTHTPAESAVAANPARPRARGWSRLVCGPRWRGVRALSVHEDGVDLFEPRVKGPRGFARTTGRDGDDPLVDAYAVAADRTDDEARGLHWPESAVVPGLPASVVTHIGAFVPASELPAAVSNRKGDHHVPGRREALRLLDEAGRQAVHPQAGHQTHPDLLVPRLSGVAADTSPLITDGQHQRKAKERGPTAGAPASTAAVGSVRAAFAHPLRCRAFGPFGGVTIPRRTA